MPWLAFLASLYEEGSMVCSCKHLSSAGQELGVQPGLEEPTHPRLQVSGLGQLVKQSFTCCVCLKYYVLYTVCYILQILTSNAVFSQINKPYL